MITDEDLDLIAEYRKLYKGFDCAFSKEPGAISLIAKREGEIKFKIWFALEQRELNVSKSSVELQSGKAWELIGWMYRFIDNIVAKKKVGKSFITEMAKARIKYRVM